jgi:hypothetical protein
VSPFDRIKRIRESGLQATDRLVMLILASYANAEGRCWPSVQTIADDSGLNERTARRVLRRLEKAKHLRKDGAGPRGTTAYIVATPGRRPPRAQRPRGAESPPGRESGEGGQKVPEGEGTAPPEESIGEESIEESKHKGLLRILSILKGREITKHSKAAPKQLANFRKKTGATIDELVLVAEAFQRCPHDMFARWIRAEQWESGTDRSGMLSALLKQANWDDRLEAAQAWTTTPEAEDRSADWMDGLDWSPRSAK